MSIEFRDYCDTSRDCREYAYNCNRNFCDCAEGYRADDKNKTCVGGKALLKLFQILWIIVSQSSISTAKCIYVVVNGKQIYSNQKP